jgi:hypothetical protein
MGSLRLKTQAREIIQGHRQSVVEQRRAAVKDEVRRQSAEEYSLAQERQVSLLFCFDFQLIA